MIFFRKKIETNLSHFLPKKDENLEIDKNRDEKTEIEGNPLFYRCDNNIVKTSFR